MKKLIFTLIFLLAASTASAGVWLTWDHPTPEDVYCFQMERCEDNETWREGKATCDGTLLQYVNLLPGDNYFRIKAEAFSLIDPSILEPSGYSNTLHLYYSTTVSTTTAPPFNLGVLP